METARRVFEAISRVGNVIAGLFLAGVAFLMVGDIIGRFAFNHPIPGTFEIVAASMAVLATIGFAFALDQRRHIRATILTERLPAKVQANLLLFAYFIGFVVTGILAWKLVDAAAFSFFELREYSAGLVRVPIYVPKMVMVFAVALFCVNFLLHFIEGFRKQG